MERSVQDDRVDVGVLVEVGVADVVWGVPNSLVWSGADVELFDFLF